MKFFRLSRPRNRRHPSRRYPLYAAAGAFAALAIALLVVGILRGRDASMLSENRAQLSSRIQSDLNMVLRAYDEMSLPKADISGSVLPTMRMHLYAADALNDVMTDIYGEDYSVIDSDFYHQITQTIDEIDKSISLGLTTDSATDQLGAYMLQMEGVLASRYGSDGVLLPKTAALNTTAP